MKKTWITLGFLLGWIGLAEAAEPSVEHLRMEGTEIQGTLEKPHVVYIIPWKESPPLAEDQIQFHRSFMKEVLEPVDRERFQRLLERSASPIP